MKKILFSIFILASAFNLLLAQTPPVAQWNGYTQGNPPADGIFLATGGTEDNNGIATLTRDGNGTGYTYAVNNDLVASSTGWTDPTTTEKYWIITFSTVGCTDLTFTSRQKSSNTGPKDFKVQYKIGASGTWTDIADATVEILNPTDFFDIEDHPLPTDMNNQSVVYMRWICTSAVSVNGNTVASTGTSRLGITVYGDFAIENPTIFVNPTTLNFGSVETGATSEPKTVAVSGAALTDIITYSKSGADASAFTIEETSWEPATGGTLSITFSPTEIRAYTASITLSSTGAEDVTVSLSGAGTQPTGELIAKWNGYTSGNPPEDGIFLATGGSDENDGIATLTRDEDGKNFAVNADGVAASAGWEDATTTDKYWMTTFSTAGYTDITFTSKQRGSDTGPKDFKVQYKVGAGEWTDVEGGTVTVANDNYLTGKLELIPLPEAVSHQAEIFLRWLCTSTASIGGGTVGGNGVNRLDVTIYGISGTAPFVPVENIINVPTSAAINEPLTLTGTVMPTNATHKTIEWSVTDAGETNATIAGNTFTATAIGTAKILATIADGLGVGEDYTQEFTIEVKEEVIYYTITATVNNSTYGEIDPPGTTQVEEGGAITYTITTFANYKILDVLVNDESQGAITTYTFDDVQSNGTIHVIFEPLSINDNELSNVLVYSHQNSIIIKNVETALFAEILDLNGRLISQHNITGAEATITLSVSNGIYIVKLMSREGKSVSRKISIVR